MPQKNHNKNNKASNTTLTLKRQRELVATKQLGDDDLTPEEEDFLQTVDDWTEFNPQTMMDQSIEGEQLCKDLTVYAGLTEDKYSDDVEVQSLISKIESLIELYRETVDGIEQWWKYSHIQE